MSGLNILLVDDQREVTRMLCAALEMTIPHVNVVEVLSAEEAMLEVLRMPFRLVVTDVMLPGMNGLEFMERVRQSSPLASLIVITGKSNAEVEAAVEQLQPTAFFTKPIDTNEFLAVVQRVLGLGETDEVVEVEVVPQLGVSERLLALRQDLGAVAVYLADVDGRIVVRAGDVPELDIEAMIAYIEVAFSAAFRVCTMLGGYVPLNMLFFDGDEFDVYVTNVGKSFMLLMIYDGESGAQQMGAVMHYGRKAADDLLNLLAQMGMAQAPEQVAMSLEADAEEMYVSEDGLVYSVEPGEPIELDLEELEAAAAKLDVVDADDFWETALAESTSESVDSNALSYEQAQKLGLVPVDEE